MGTIELLILLLVLLWLFGWLGGRRGRSLVLAAAWEAGIRRGAKALLPPKGSWRHAKATGCK